MNTDNSFQRFRISNQENINKRRIKFYEVIYELEKWYGSNNHVMKKTSKNIRVIQVIDVLKTITKGSCDELL